MKKSSKILILIGVIVMAILLGNFLLSISNNCEDRASYNERNNLCMSCSCSNNNVNCVQDTSCVERLKQDEAIRDRNQELKDSFIPFTDLNPNNCIIEEVCSDYAVFEKKNNSIIKASVCQKEFISSTACIRKQMNVTFKIECSKNFILEGENLSTDYNSLGVCTDEIIVAKKVFEPCLSKSLMIRYFNDCEIIWYEKFYIIIRGLLI